MACQRQFSPTTGTPFASRKLSYRDILIAIALFAKAPKGMSAIRLSHELEVWYKTAFVLLHKLREQVGIEQHRHALKGAVEIDGAYFGGHVRPNNNKPLRKDRRRLPHQSGKRQCVTVIRERGGRSRAFVRSESDTARLASEVIEAGTIIYADESPAYNRLHGRYDVRRINHEKLFAEGDISTNHAESSHSRMRRAEIGIHHHISGTYLDAYADEMTWREDHRRRDDLEKFTALVGMMTRGGVSRMWKGYWQRRKAAA